MPKSINRENVELALSKTGQFNMWKDDIEKNKLSDKGMETRMKYVVSAIEMGVTLATALQMCYVRQDDFMAWVQIDRNRERLDRANARAEAQLEYIVHQYAMLVPEFALQVLAKRNAKRWDPPATQQFERGVKAGQKMSAMLTEKNDAEEEFDVTI